MCQRKCPSLEWHQRSLSSQSLNTLYVKEYYAWGRSSNKRRRRQRHANEDFSIKHSSQNFLYFFCKLSGLFYRKSFIAVCVTTIETNWLESLLLSVALDLHVNSFTDSFEIHSFYESNKLLSMINVSSAFVTQTSTRNEWPLFSFWVFFRLPTDSVSEESQEIQEHKRNSFLHRLESQTESVDKTEQLQSIN